jgi:hypothetical protein
MQTPCVNRRSQAFCLIGKIRGLRKEIALLKMTTTRDPCTGKFWRAARRRDPRFSGRLTGPFNSGSHVEKLMSSGRAQHVAAATPTHKPDVSPPARKKSPSPIEDNPELSGDGGPFSSFYDAQRSQGRNQVPFLLTKTAAFIYLFFLLSLPPSVEGITPNGRRRIGDPGIYISPWRLYKEREKNTGIKDGLIPL